MMNVLLFTTVSGVISPTSASPSYSATADTWDDGGHQAFYAAFQAGYNAGFSAGGADNEDLPESSSYRSVTPMACTISISDDVATVRPWEIDYRRFNDPKVNRFFASKPEIEHKVE